MLISRLLRQEDSKITKNLFPFIVCILASLFASYVIYFDPFTRNQNQTVFKIILAIYSFLPFGFILSRLEEYQSKLERKLRIRITSILILIQVFLLTQIYFIDVDYERSVFMFLAIEVMLHLLIAFFPFWATKNQFTFWNSNKRMFLRFLLSQIYAGVFQAAVSAAFGITMYLFNLEDFLKEEFFGVIAIISFGIIAPFVFLSGNPLRLESEQEYDYHKILHNFFHYLIRPIIWLYFIILYLYIFIHVFSGELPNGILPYLILVVSGIVFFYLTMRKPYSKSRLAEVWYLSLLIPLILTLFYAVGIRISDYGITEPRYIIVILGMLILGNSIYGVVRNFSIPIFLISSIGCLLIGSFGPLSATAFSIRSQTAKAHQLFIDYTGKSVQEFTLADHDALSEEPKDQEEREIRKSLRSTIQFLDDVHAYHDFASNFQPQVYASLNDSPNEKGNDYDFFRFFYLNYKNGSMYYGRNNDYQYALSRNQNSIQFHNLEITQIEENYINNAEFRKTFIGEIKMVVNLNESSIRLYEENYLLGEYDLSDLLSEMRKSAPDNYYFEGDLEIPFGERFTLVLTEFSIIEKVAEENVLYGINGYLIEELIN